MLPWVLARYWEMMLKRFKCICSVFLWWMISTAEAGTNGIYVLQGGNYSLKVEFGESTLTTIEPNRTSVYKQVRPGTYEFINQNNRNIRYWMTVIDDRTLEASKPDTDAAPTRLILQQGAAARQVVETNRNWAALADKYMHLSERDPDNIQSWTMCATTAYSRSTMSQADGDAYAAKTAALLKQMGASNQSPCPEVISF